MDSIRLKTKELQCKMYFTQTHRLIDSLDSQKRSTPFKHLNDVAFEIIREYI